ncbi:hypothetical protein D9M71_316060 [compost metagenome]
MAVAYIGLDAAVVDLAVGHGADIGDGFVGRVLPAERLDAVVAGYPDATTGNRRGAAVAVALLHHQHLGSQVMGAQGGGHRASSRTHHQYVAAVVPLRAVRAHRVAPLLFCACAFQPDSRQPSGRQHRPLGLRGGALPVREQARSYKSDPAAGCRSQLAGEGATAPFQGVSIAQAA